MYVVNLVILFCIGENMIIMFMTFMLFQAGPLVVLCGPDCSYKHHTSVGRLLGEALQVSFVDVSHEDANRQIEENWVRGIDLWGSYLE